MRKVREKAQKNKKQLDIFPMWVTILFGTKFPMGKHM